VSEDPFNVPRWHVHGERTLYDNPWVRLTQVDVEPPDGARWWHHVVRLQTVAAALVLDDQDRVLMLWRHRFVPDTFGWELPGGIVGAGETGAATAVRETEEETGWRPTGEPELLIAFEPMPGMVDTPHEVYLVRGAEHVGEPTDAQEAGHVAWVPLADVPELARTGKIAGSGSLVGLLYLLASRRAEG
jgi:8-oxo-dGTP pyrophosphatase MutT (NUDIX family)